MALATQFLGLCRQYSRGNLNDLLVVIKETSSARREQWEYKHTYGNILGWLAIQFPEQEDYGGKDDSDLAEEILSRIEELQVRPDETLDYALAFTELLVHNQWSMRKGYAYSSGRCRLFNALLNVDPPNVVRSNIQGQEA